MRQNGTTDAQHAVMQAHPDAPIAGVPDEILCLLYPELFPYGPATFAFRAATREILSALTPYTHGYKQQRMMHGLNHLDHKVSKKASLLANPRWKAVQYGGLTFPLFYKRMGEDFPPLNSVTEFTQGNTADTGRGVSGVALMKASEARAALIKSILPNLLTSLTERATPSDSDPLTKHSTALLEAYEQWRRRYLVPEDKQSGLVSHGKK